VSRAKTIAPARESITDLKSTSDGGGIVAAGREMAKGELGLVGLVIPTHAMSSAR
jgi:hypothetical protein